MAIKVRVTVKGKGKNLVNCEINGGTNYDYDAGSHEFTIGQQQSMITFLTVKRLDTCNVKISPLSGDVSVDIDSDNTKRIKKGSSISLSSNQTRVVVRERP